MKKSLLILIVFLSTVLASSAQVGIGGVPNTNSILDLTNGTKWLILPKSPASPALNPTFISTEASLYYYNSKLYLSGLSGVNVLTPWQWNGTATGFISSPAGNPVGIGFVPTVANFSFSVAHIGEVVAASGGNASIMVGDPTANHLLIDNNEIMAKTNPTTAGVLKLQEEGSGIQGTVEIRSAADAGENAVLTAYGSVDAKGKMMENGKQLLPAGAIIMWSGGATAPAGWALCVGGTGTREDGTGTIQIPDLRDRFVIASGPAYPMSALPAANTGGATTVTVPLAALPTHSHGVGTIATTSAGSHTHPNNYNFGWTGGDGDAGSDYYYGTENDTGGSAAQGAAGDHTHPMTGITDPTGAGAAFGHMPPYYALAFIIKL
ncbi:MAG TPA: hypothetical protein VGC65_09640 [Bacteroidia bacterium]|jgi:microcystin-dependent protein